MIAGLALYLVLVGPPMAAWLERTMVGHMLLQIPLLALAGGLVARGIFGRHGAGLAGFNAAGISGLLVAVFVAAVWMLPRTLDAALRVISHAAVLGWLYRAAPDRLCARYLFDQQATVGAALLIIAIALLLALALYAIAGSPWQGADGWRSADRARTPASRV